MGGITPGYVGASDQSTGAARQAQLSQQQAAEQGAAAYNAQRQQYYQGGGLAPQDVGRVGPVQSGGPGSQIGQTGPTLQGGGQVQMRSLGDVMGSPEFAAARARGEAERAAIAEGRMPPSAIMSGQTTLIGPGQNIGRPDLMPASQSQIEGEKLAQASGIPYVKGMTFWEVAAALWPIGSDVSKVAFYPARKEGTYSPTLLAAGGTIYTSNLGAFEAFKKGQLGVSGGAGSWQAIIQEPWKYPLEVQRLGLVPQTPETKAYFERTGARPSTITKEGGVYTVPVYSPQYQAFSIQAATARQNVENLMSEARAKHWVEGSTVMLPATAEGAAFGQRFNAAVQNQSDIYGRALAAGVIVQQDIAHGSGYLPGPGMTRTAYDVVSGRTITESGQLKAGEGISSPVLMGQFIAGIKPTMVTPLPLALPMGSPGGGLPPGWQLTRIGPTFKGTGERMNITYTKEPSRDFWLQNQADVMRQAGVTSDRPLTLGLAQAGLDTSKYLESLNPLRNTGVGRAFWNVWAGLPGMAGTATLGGEILLRQAASGKDVVKPAAAAYATTLLNIGVGTIEHPVETGVSLFSAWAGAVAISRIGDLPTQIRPRGFDIPGELERVGIAGQLTPEEVARMGRTKQQLVERPTLDVRPVVDLTPRIDLTSGTVEVTTLTAWDKAVLGIESGVRASGAMRMTLPELANIQAQYSAAQYLGYFLTPETAWSPMTVAATTPLVSTAPSLVIPTPMAKLSYPFILSGGQTAIGQTAWLDTAIGTATVQRMNTMIANDPILGSTQALSQATSQAVVQAQTNMQQGKQREVYSLISLPLTAQAQAKATATATLSMNIQGAMSKEDVGLVPLQMPMVGPVTIAMPTFTPPTGNVPPPSPGPQIPWFPPLPSFGGGGSGMGPRRRPFSFINWSRAGLDRSTFPELRGGRGGGRPPSFDLNYNPFGGSWGSEKPRRKSGKRRKR